MSPAPGRPGRQRWVEGGVVGLGVQTFLVTGAAGFIASHTCEALLARGDRVVGVDNFDPFYPESMKRDNIESIRRAAGSGGAFEFVVGDITDREQMRLLFERVKPDTLIHLAAKAGVRPSLENPAAYAHANVTGTSVLLEAAHQAGVRRCVVASSSSVYGTIGDDETPRPFSEEQSVERPISPYAATKRACELLGFTHHHLTGRPVAMLRFFTVFGPRQRPDLAIRLFMERIATGKTITVFGDGGTSRDYTFIGDIVRGVLASCEAIDRHGYRIWNLGGSSPVTLETMIDSIARVVGVEPKMERRAGQPGDVRATWADLSRSRRELGYEPATPFLDGLRRQWEWLKPRLERATS